jgi:hypothetical protein
MEDSGLNLTAIDILNHKIWVGREADTSDAAMPSIRICRCVDGRPAGEGPIRSRLSCLAPA